MKFYTLEQLKNKNKNKGWSFDSIPLKKRKKKKEAKKPLDLILFEQATITNNSNLPQAIINAIKNDPYDKGNCDFSITELVYKTSRQRALLKKHAHEIEEDAEDMLYRLYGQIAHGILERANDLDLSEKRFFAQFKEHIVSAQIDTLSLHGGVLTDYKFTTSWGLQTDKEIKLEWLLQLNGQLEILRRNGLDAKKLQIVALLRDWHIRDAKLKPEYPKSPIVIRNIPIWPREKISLFIERRIEQHLLAEKVLPDCSDEERWVKEPKWAVVKPSKTTKSGKRAVDGGVCDTEEGAKAVLQYHTGASIEFRPGSSIRCEDYCAVSEFCSQFKKIKGE